MTLTPVQSGTPTTATHASNATVVVDRPAGAATGDQVVVIVRNQLSGNTTEPSISGFTSAGPAWDTGTVSQFRRNRILIKRIADINAEPTTYTVSVPGGGRTAVVAVLVRDAATNAVQGKNPTYGGTKFVGGVSAPGMSFADTPALAIAMAAGDFGANVDHTPTAYPSGYTDLAEVVTYAGGGSDNTVSRTYLWVGVQALTSSPSNEAQMTWGTDQTNYAAESIVVKGGLAGVSVALGPISTAGHLTVWDGTERRTAVAARVLRPGFPSVATMTAKAGATWAHRGGSANYPEMTEWAYDQAVLRGFGVLEFSCQRSSDGVWFGLHDTSFDRTSEVEGSLNASDMTWAQIQATYQVTLNSNGTPRPYWKLTDFIAKWGDSHVLVIDPKNSAGQSALRTEFLDLLDAHADPSRTIVKVFAGDNIPWTTMADLAKGRGYTTFGYFYEVDYTSGDVAAYESHYDILGMQFDASGATWTGMQGFGKPLVGHIATDQADYATAIANGADIVQCSGVGVITPVTYP